MSEDTGRTPLPPYVPFRAFLNLLTYLEEGVPRRIDRSFWGKHYSGATGAQLMTGLRFLGLVEGDSNVPTPRLKQLVEEKASRKQLLAELLRDRYAPIFTYVGDLSSATPGHLDEAFRNTYKIRDDTLRKAISFFVHVAQDADIPISKYITEKTRMRTAPSRGSSRTNGKKSRPGTTKAGKESGVTAKLDAAQASSSQTNIAGGHTKRITLRKGDSLTLIYTGDILNMDRDDREFVFQLIDEMEGHAQEISDEELYDEEEGADEEEDELA